MGDIKKRKRIWYPYEFKVKVVEEYLNEHISYVRLAKKYSIDEKSVRHWISLYNSGTLNHDTHYHRPGNRWSALTSAKNLTDKQRLELENLKLRIENERLKKGYLVKGGGANKEYVSISGKNTKSLKN